MFPRIARSAAAITALTGVLTFAVRPASAQTAAPATQAPTVEKQLRARQVAPAPAVTSTEDPNAERTREELMNLFRKYPPSVARVMKLDPSLLLNSDYLATYPALNSFLAQHPEVSRSPGYYLDRIQTSSVEYVDTRSSSTRLFEEILDWVGGVTVACLVALSLSWVIRTFVDYRRWYRLSRIQTEVHNKLLDRMTSNEEMLAYVKSPAGARFLESAPITLDAGPIKRIGAPYSRILWSIQAGVVLLVVGLGLRYIASTFANDLNAQQGVGAFGILGISIGVGFILSGLVSYVLSRRLGLLDDEQQAAGPRPMIEQ